MKLLRMPDMLLQNHTLLLKLKEKETVVKNQKINKLRKIKSFKLMSQNKIIDMLLQIKNSQKLSS
jgi:hypothetical protein